MSLSHREGDGPHPLSDAGVGFDVPVVLILFNRPELTAEVWKAIRQLQPKRLFVIADGPRAHASTDPERCRRARAVTEDIDWSCRVKRIHADRNLGCRRRATGSAGDGRPAQVSAARVNGCGARIRNIRARGSAAYAK